MLNRWNLCRQKTQMGSSMRTSVTHTACFLTALVVAAGTTRAAATPLTPFRYEAQAQRHCPADTVVWLDFRKGSITSNGKLGTRRATREASCVGRKRAAAAIAARCLDCVRTVQTNFGIIVSRAPKSARQVQSAHLA
jgi:hypothetical protein